MNAKDTNCKQTVSFIILGDTGDEPMNGRCDEAACYRLPVPESSMDGQFRMDRLHPITDPEKPASIDTPWVLLMEGDEGIEAQDLKRLVDYCRTAPMVAAQLFVERFISLKTTGRYGWVTTREKLKNAPPAIRRYTSLETRLIPTTELCHLKICLPQTASSARFILEMSEDGTATAPTCPAAICRRAEFDRSREISRPPDRDIFRYGHERYFDDRAFVRRFAWPHTSYHTIRHDHVPSIRAALQQGLSTPQIMVFTLNYLLRFRQFSEAMEIIHLIPKHWFGRNPNLTNAAAACHFINGSIEEALALYEGLLQAFPDSDYIAKNAIKFNILAERYDAVDRIFDGYQRAAGRKLKDDYYDQFTAVHGSAPQRTATLSVCLIVRDEAQLLERAISSIKAIADEIILVDTGSDDGSKKIAASLGARVYDFPWSDDFAAARNYAVSKASCDYIFMLDGDEYIPPFFFTELQTLKKLFPLNAPCAFSVPIGSYFNKTDWLFVVRESGNFRVEISSVRIFPRLPQIQYRGQIMERIEPALTEQGIPIRSIKHDYFQIVHDHRNRKERIGRKVHLYHTIDNPTEAVLLAAIRDFVKIGRAGEAISMMRAFYSRQCETSESIKLGLHLATLLAAADLQEAETLYQDLNTRYPENTEILSAYATFLITNNRISDLGSLTIPDAVPEEAKERADFLCILSLVKFATGQKEKALEILTAILDENAFTAFPQALLFYYMAIHNNIEGVISAMDALFTLMACRKNIHLEQIEDVFSIAEDLYRTMIDANYRREASLVLHGITILGTTWGIA